MLQATKENVTNAEKLLNNIEKFSDNIINVFNDQLISTGKIEMKRDNFSKMNKISTPSWYAHHSSVRHTCVYTYVHIHNVCIRTYNIHLIH